uniref:DUF222 domain-containing protein n=1 Tax=Trebonia sp. TaxID=2767075 RepID=UPI00261CF4AC
MPQSPAAGHGPGAEPGRDTGLPGGGGPRDLSLADFAQDGAGGSCQPGPRLAAVIAGLSGPDWRCDGATDEQLLGLLDRWAALESWAAAGKLGLLRELIRRRVLPGAGGNWHGDLPDAWEEGLAHEVTAALGMSLPAADKLLGVAWELQVRLPGIGGRLADGTIDLLKAKIIADELFVLGDEQAARAGAMIAGELAGKTPGQIGRLAAAAACTVDPLGAQKRREHAEREDARVRFWRDHGGACALAAYGLPADAALAANANVNERAAEYKKAKIMPDARMDQLRVLAFLDLLNGVAAAARITQAQAEAQGDSERGRAESSGHDSRPDGGCPDNGHADDGGRDDSRADDEFGHGGPADGGHGSGSGDGPDGGSGRRGDGGPAGGPPAGTGATGAT